MMTNDGANTSAVNVTRQVGTTTEVLLRVDKATGDVVLGGGLYTSNRLRLGAFYLWVDGTGRLRIKSGAPASDTDGTVVGTQT
jgi:hypothetical protein